MKSKSYLRALLGVCLFFLTCIIPVMAATPEELIEEGKQALLENYDIYAADAKFAEALNYPADPNYQKANFWRAFTILFTNPDLKATSVNLGIIGDSGDADATDDILVFDKEWKNKYSLSTVDTIIIDNKDVGKGYSEEGNGWYTPDPTPDNAYDTDCRMHPTSSISDKAIWTPNIMTTGDYNVYAWSPYLGYNNFYTTVIYRVYYDGGYKDIRVFQQFKPNCNKWISLGKFKFSAGQEAKIELFTDFSGDTIVADAVKLVFDGTYVSENPPDAILNGNWEEVVESSANGGSYRKIEAGSGGSCVWRPNIPVAGKYQIFGHGKASYDNATDAVYEINLPTGSTTKVSVNQRNKHCKKVNLGIYDLPAGTGTAISLLQNANGKVTTDGIRVLSVKTFPDLTKLQSDFADTINQINEALGYLNNITDNFQDTADFHARDNSGNRIITEIDYGDVLTLKALLNFIKEELAIFASYSVKNINPQDLTVNYHELFTINTVLKRFSTFAKLTPEASTMLPDAKQALIDGINSYLAAYDFIIHETDPQEDDLVKFNAGDIPDIINTKLREILANLDGSSPSYTVRSDDIFYDDPVQANKEPFIKTAVNLRDFFDNPKQFRYLLPHFNNKNIPARSSTPDPTFGGLFPNMTQEELNGIYSLGSFLEQPYVLWDDTKVSITLNWEKDNYHDFVSYKIFRSTEEDVNEASENIYESAKRAKVSFMDNNLDAKRRIYYYRLYTYYADGDKIASPIRRVITKYYVNGATSGKEDGSPEYPYKSISAATKLLKRGGKVCIAGGTYEEQTPPYSGLQILDSTGITLEGGYEASTWTRSIKANSTIIKSRNAFGSGAVVLRYCNNITLNGLIFEGSPNGVFMHYSKIIKIKNCIFINSSYAGINLLNSTADIDNCTASYNVYGVYACYSGFSITNSKILKNSWLGLQIVEIQSKSQIKNCVIANNGSRGIQLIGPYTNITVQNNFIQRHSTAGIECQGDASPQIINNTIMYSKIGLLWTDGIAHDSKPTVKNNIILLNEYGIEFRAPAVPIINYNDVWNNSMANYSGCKAGNQDISAKPIFVRGPQGAYYLSQINAGQTVNSPCVDAGSTTASSLGLDSRTTNTSSIPDTGKVDMGYHYRPRP